MSKKTVIMTGFHFPPSAQSSGHLRLLAFAKYLPDYGWNPVVLSATANAYEHIDATNVRDIPESCSVYRAFAFDAKRHFSVMGKYPSLLAIPDRWSSWWPTAVFTGLRLIRRYRARAIWSTFPIMTSHAIAYTLHRMTGLPWIADFRDPVAISTVGKHPMAVRSQSRWERLVVSCAARTVFTTPGAMQRCGQQFPEALRAGRLAVIANGYDDEAFEYLAKPPEREGRPLVLLHSGHLYPQGRNPIPFLSALARLSDVGYITSDSLRVVLRASGTEVTLEQEIERLKLGDIVSLAPPVGNREAIQVQASADGLLLFQGREFDLQIPAKIYEYLRIGHPVLAMVGPDGDTASLLRDSGRAVLVAEDDVDAIEAGLREYLQVLVEDSATTAQETSNTRYSRRAGTMQLASLLDDIGG